MGTLRVWAPLPHSVETVVDGRRLQMSKAARGWWEVSDGAVHPGARYGFSLDGGEPRPDPRSPSQPDGVMGLSEVIDHAAHEWHDQAWHGRELAGAVLYELHVGTFSREGTFEGAIQHLSHLTALGVDMIEVMPVAEFSGNRGWGYDGVDLFAPHHAYGGPAGFKRLVEACHAGGLGVVLDVVYNHLGPVGNFLAEFGPYFSSRHTTDWGAALNFDGPGSDEVRRLVIDNELMWMRDYHVDGLRLDAVHAIFDQSPVHVLEQMRVEADALRSEVHRPLSLIAESDLNDPRFVRPREVGGYGLEGVWSDDWHHSLHTVLTGERTGYYEDFGQVEDLGKALRQAWVYDGRWSDHRQSTRGRKAHAIESHRHVVAIQNHDQVGNRAAGERLVALVDEASLKAAAALLLTTQFTPMLFEGEEWGASTPFQYFTDHADPRLGDAVREGRRREFAAFGWNPEEIPDPQDAATFERSRLRWEEIDEPMHRRMLDWYRALIDLRRRLPVRHGPPHHVRVAVAEDQRRITFERDGLSVLVNLGSEDWSPSVAAGARLLLTSDLAISSDAGGLCLPPSSVAIVQGLAP